MISAFGVVHEFSKSQLPGFSGYKRAVDLTETDKRNIRTTMGWDDRKRFGRPMHERGFKASRYRPETIAGWKNRRHDARFENFTRAHQAKIPPVAPLAAKSVRGKVALAAGGVALGGAAAGAGVLVARRKKS